jgi:hypothetical protein
VGVTTQDSALELRLDPAVGAKRQELFEVREHGIDHHRARLRQAGGASCAPSPDADTLMPGGSGDELTPRDAGVVLFAS